MTFATKSRPLFFACVMFVGKAPLADEVSGGPPAALADTCGGAAGRYDPNFALWLSGTVTFGGLAVGGVFIVAGTFSPGVPIAPLAIGGAILGGALLLGPSAGHFYVKNYGWSLGRFGMRMALAGIGTFGMFMWMDSELCSDEYDDCGSGTWGLPIMIVASVGYVAIMAWDFATVKRAAREANARHRRSPVEVAVSPALFGSRGRDGGLMLVGRF